MVQKLEEEVVTMLAAIPTHLDEQNHSRIKKMTKTYRTKVEYESGLIRGKLQQAISSNASMQKRIRQLEAELKAVKEDVSLKEALALMEASNKEQLTQLSQSLTQDDMFEEKDDSDNVKQEEERNDVD